MTAADGAPPASSPDPLAAVHVLVMAKVPVPGRVNTRLARRIGDAAACALHVACIDDLAARLARTGADVTWAWTPDEGAVPNVAPRARHRRQRGADLGARMADAIAALWEASPRPVLVLGVDAPHVPLEWWRAGAAALAHGTDVVLGPALDGGYWTIGLRTPQPALFADVAWGTERVYAVSRDRVAVLGLSLLELPCTFDVDEWDDLARLRAAIEATPGLLPATARVLASLPP